MRIFPNTQVQHLLRESSNHYLILVNTLGAKENKKKDHSNFFQAWCSNPYNCPVVEEAWNQEDGRGMHRHRLKKSLLLTTKGLQCWNKQVFRYANVKIQKLETEILELHGSGLVDYKKDKELLKELCLHES